MCRLHHELITMNQYQLQSLVWALSLLQKMQRSESPCILSLLSRQNEIVWNFKSTRANSRVWGFEMSNPDAFWEAAGRTPQYSMPWLWFRPHSYAEVSGKSTSTPRQTVLSELEPAKLSLDKLIQVSQSHFRFLIVSFVRSEFSAHFRPGLERVSIPQKTSRLLSSRYIAEALHCRGSFNFITELCLNAVGQTKANRLPSFATVY